MTLGQPQTLVHSINPTAPIQLADNDQRDPGKEITDDPHGDDPHGKSADEEVHDPKMPANDSANNPYAARDVYGNRK